MFRKVLFVFMLATAGGYCLAAENAPLQVVTSEVFYTRENDARENNYRGEVRNNYEYETVAPQYQAPMPPAMIPVWPLPGSDADATVSCDGLSDTDCPVGNEDNIRIVSKMGDDLVVENNFAMPSRSMQGTWSGGADMLHGGIVPLGFDNDCDSGAEMPLLSREMLEDDGGAVLAVSRSDRRCIRAPEGGTTVVNNITLGSNGNFVPVGSPAAEIAALTARAEEFTFAEQAANEEILVDISADAEAPKELPDQVRSWVVASGQNLRDVLQGWSDKEGWDLVWNTAREYPIEASAVFKGRFVDVASALVRNFSRANPVPYAKFYKGNRVLVISTTEE